MRVLVTGGTGFVGKALVHELRLRGDHTTVLTRDTEGARKQLPRDVRVAKWNPKRRGAWQDEVGVVDAVVHLAGKPVAQRWTTKTKRVMVESRVKSCELLVDAVAKAQNKPAVFVCASGINYYGDSRKGRCVETTAAGDGEESFLSDLCQRWESVARSVAEHDVRSVQLRIGLVLGPGGALEKMLAPMRMFVAGPIGDGDNITSWIHIDDVVGMILWAIDNEEVSGAINCTSPSSNTAKELAEKAGSVIGRPNFKTPKRVVRAVLGDAVDPITGSLDVYPERAIELGYAYHHVSLVPALEAALMPDG